MNDFLGQFKDKVFDFYGVWSNCFKLNDLVFEAVEDPDDGYRSYLGSIQLADANNLQFPNFPICQVKIIENNYEGFDLVELKSNRAILEVGTDRFDDYYPCFLFRYNGVEIFNSPVENFENAKNPFFALSKLINA